MSEFDRHASTYASAVNDSIAFSGLKVDTFVQAKVAHLRRIFRDYAIDQKDLIADVGCGVGTYEKILIREWPKLSGIDVSRESVLQARESCPTGSFQAFDGKAMPFESGSVSAAFAICVWHHVPVDDWSLFLSEVMRVLRPGGIFLVFEHNPWNPLTRWAVERCVFDQNAVLLSLPNARRRLEDAGFSIQSADYILSIPVASGFASQLDRLLKAVPTGAQYVVVGRKALLHDRA